MATFDRCETPDQATIPNDQLAGNDIENVGRRKHIRRVSELHIPLDTSCEKVEQAVAIIREELDDHEGMDPDRPPRVFLDEFSSDAFIINFYYWYSPPDFWKFRAFGNRLNFAIFRKFEAAGIQFSLTFRHSFWKQNDEQGPMDVNSHLKKFKCSVKACVLKRHFAAVTIAGLCNYGKNESLRHDYVMNW